MSDVVSALRRAADQIRQLRAENRRLREQIAELTRRTARAEATQNVNHGRLMGLETELEIAEGRLRQLQNDNIRLRTAAAAAARAAPPADVPVAQPAEEPDPTVLRFSILELDLDKEKGDE